MTGDLFARRSLSTSEGTNELGVRQTYLVDENSDPRPGLHLDLSVADHEQRREVVLRNDTHQFIVRIKTKGAQRTHDGDFSTEQQQSVQRDLCRVPKEDLGRLVLGPVAEEPGADLGLPKEDGTLARDDGQSRVA